LRPIGIVSALPAEARALGPSAPHGAELRRLDEGALLAVSGMGRAAAAAAARRLVLAGARALVSFGMAGGLDPTLICGTVLLPEEVAAADGTVPDVLPTSGDWRQRLRAAMPGTCLVCCGRLLTSRQPIARPAAKADAWRHTGAVAVDMESAAVSQVAAQAGLPFIALRVIVDTAADELPAAVIAASAGGGLRVGRLIGGLLRAPADVAPLIRLSARYRIATRMLAAVVAADSLARRVLLGGPEAEVS
jgi:adenosylhomocysteine nucleosidase